MKLKLYQIDAFANHVFEGNPAAVCPLPCWLDDTIMQRIAMENNLAETAFFVNNGDGYDLRWFTPTKEVDLCGHATLASAYVLFEQLDYPGDTITFNSRSGPLRVSRHGELLTLDFPAEAAQPCETPQAVIDAFGKEPLEVLKSADYIVVFDDGEDITAFKPDMTLLKTLDLRGVCITAKGSDCDFVSRFFAPNYGIDEDSVTGSAHTQLAPYWSTKLNKRQMSAKQLSARGGELMCELSGNRVLISGRAVPYFSGEITI